MNQEMNLMLHGLIAASVPLIVFGAVFVTGYVVRKILFKRLSRWAEKTASSLDDVILSAVKGPSVIWILMLAIYFCVETSGLPGGIVDALGKVMLVLGVLSVTIVINHIAGKAIKIYSSNIASILPLTSLTHNFSRILVFGIGILIILNGLGISIAPILATLGVGGLAVALALQDTLSNLFSGFHIMLARQVKIGDFIKLESGEEGYVTDINWRTTKVKMLPNNVVLIPNSKLAQAIIVNYDLPDKETAVLVQVGVHYDSDLKKVEKVTCEVAQEVMRQVLGGVPGFEPFIRYHTFADFSINFTVILRVREFVDQYLTRL
jgi:small-conductance mechanosensitive channel